MTTDATPMKKVSFAEAFEIARTLHRNGRHDEAAAIYDRLLALAPDDPDVLHYAGLLDHKKGNIDRGLARVRRSTELQPGFAGFWNNLGNMLRERKDLDGAYEAYQRCLALEPESGAIHNNLASIRALLGDHVGAEADYRRAIELMPTFSPAYDNLARLLLELGRRKEALTSTLTGVVASPAFSESYEMLGMAHTALGQHAKAIEVYERWAKQVPDHPVPHHMLAALRASDAPARASDRYVTTLFDDFAESFDEQLKGIGYRAPELCASALAAATGGDPVADLLDAGCGTGLCGPLLRPMAGRLAGVDLSAGMLAKAEARGVYDELHVAELVAHLSATTGAWDAVVSADTLCYFGVLDDFADAARGALRPGGHLVFTVEALPDEVQDPWRLLDHGRYAHRRSYVETVLRVAGFSLREIRGETLRIERSESVTGWLVTAQRT